MGDKEAVRRAITRKINELYGDLGLTSPASGGQQAVPIPQAVSTSSVSSAAPVSGPYLDWTARVHVKKYELGGSFSVVLFIGEVPENPEDWYTSPSFAGAHSAFVNSSSERCENCTRQEQAGAVTEGFIHLNNAIARKVSSFEDKVVEPLLKKELHWRVIKVRG